MTTPNQKPDDEPQRCRCGAIVDLGQPVQGSLRTGEITGCAACRGFFSSGTTTTIRDLTPDEKTPILERLDVLKRGPATSTTTDDEEHGGVTTHNGDRVKWRRFPGGSWAGIMAGIATLHAMPPKTSGGLFEWSVWIHGTCLGQGRAQDIRGAKGYAELCYDRRESEVFNAIRVLDCRRAQ